MGKYIRTVVVCVVTAILLLLCRVGFCADFDVEFNLSAEYEFEDNYTTPQADVWTTEEDSVCSGEAFLELYTRTASDTGYYVEYTVNVQKSGAYELTVDCTELGGNVYCEVYVSVNGGELYNLYNHTGVGVPQSSGLDRLTMKYLPGFTAGDNTIRFTVLNSRPRDSLYIAYLDCFSLRKADFGIQSVDITGDTAYNIAEYGSSVGVVLSFSEECSADTSLTVAVSDYWGNEIFSEDYQVNKGDTYLTAEFGALDKGHYTVAVGLSGEILSQSFVSVVTPLNKRIRFSDTPFGIDTAFSIVAPREEIDDNLMAFKLTGASWMRDRLILSSISKKGDKWDFSGSYSDEVYTKAKELGIKTHAMIQSMPGGVLDADSSANSESITKNYIGLYDLGKQMAKYYDGRVATFEIFNEPDTFVGSSDNETGDKFADFVKAFAMGIYDSEASVGVTAPGYSAVRTEPLELGLRNGMLDYVDAGAYHSHQTYSSEYKTQSLKMHPTQNFYNLINAYGYTQKQTWLDESGISMGSSDSASLSASEQRKQASYYVMSICEGLSKGADKVFSYLFHDKRSRFSWFSRHNEGPNRVYTAYSVMTDVLGEGECLGTVNYFDGVQGYVFKNGAKQILVLRSDTKLDIDIPVSAASVEIIKADGSSSVKYPSSGYITVGVSTDPIFVSAVGKYDESLYNARDRKINDFQIENNGFSEAEKIILHQTYPSETRTNAKYDGYQLGEETIVEVEVSNLNPTAKQGVIYAESFSGWEISPREQSVSVDAYGTATLYFTVSKTDAVIDNQKSAVVFKGEFDNEYTAESVAEIVHTGDIEYQQIRSMPELLDASAWTKSACSGTTSAIETTDSGLSFKFDFSVAASDKWAYPYFTFSAAQDFSEADGFLIRYNSSESFSDYDRLSFSVWLGEKDGGRYITSYGAALEKGENVWLIPFSEFTHRNGNEIDNILTTDNINYISVGVNSKGGVLDIPEFTITDFGLYCAEEPQGRYAEALSAELCSHPETESKYGCIKVSFSIAQINADLSSVRVFVDNKECKSYVYGDAVYAALPCGIENGEHNVFVSYSCEDTKSFYKELTVSSRNFAVWTEEKPSVWYAEAEAYTNLNNTEVELVGNASAAGGEYAEISILSDTGGGLEYSFEISEDGYYSLYATAADGGEYAECVLEIEDVYTFSLNDARSEAAYSGMAYYDFESVYLPKGEYKLRVSKNADSVGLIALDCIGLIYEYEVISRVEGEAYSGITFDNYGTSTSGGSAYLYANSQSEQDGESYSITYSLPVPCDGEYILCAVTAPTDSQYYSPYRLEIDNEIILNSHYSEEEGADIGDLKPYMYGELYLEGGEHTIEVTVENRREKGSPLGYYLWIDCIELRKKASPESVAVKYNYASLDIENIYDYSVYPDIYCKTTNEDNSLSGLDIINQPEVLPGDKVLKKFTVKSVDAGLKGIYIWDRENFLNPLCEAVIFD